MSSKIISLQIQMWHVATPLAIQTPNWCS